MKVRSAVRPNPTGPKSRLAGSSTATGGLVPPSFWHPPRIKLADRRAGSHHSRGERTPTVRFMNPPVFGIALRDGFDVQEARSSGVRTILAPNRGGRCLAGSGKARRTDSPVSSCSEPRWLRVRRRFDPVPRRAGSLTRSAQGAENNRVSVSEGPDRNGGHGHLSRPFRNRRARPIAGPPNYLRSERIRRSKAGLTTGCLSTAGARLPGDRGLGGMRGPWCGAPRPASRGRTASPLFPRVRIRRFPRVEP
jgi:hypothetical protein